MAPPHKIDDSNDASTSFSSCLLFFSDYYYSDWHDEWECSLFLLLWLPRRDFCWFESKKILWRRTLNPQPSDVIHDKLDHRTTMSCFTLQVFDTTKKLRKYSTFSSFLLLKGNHRSIWKPYKAMENNAFDKNNCWVWNWVIGNSKNKDYLSTSSLIWSSNPIRATIY